MRRIPCLCSLTVISLMVACSSTSRNNASTSCAPGELVECNHPSGCSSFAVCLDSGKPGSCECEGGSGADAVGASGGSSSDSGGGADSGGSGNGSGGSGNDSSGSSGSGVGGSSSGGSGSGTGGSGNGGSGTGGSGSGTGGSGNGGSGTGGSGVGGSSNGGSGSGTGGSGNGGSGGSAGGPTRPPLVTSGQGSYWQLGEVTLAGSSADISVDSTQVFQEWFGWGGTFNEAGWDALMALSEADRQRALSLLFDVVDGLALDWGRVPMGPSDYAVARYTLSNSASHFAIDHDRQYLIPYLKAAQAVNPAVKYWASPWTPPPWAKTGTTQRPRQG